MARLNTYRDDNILKDEDRIPISSYEGEGQAGAIFQTRNVTLSKLAEFFDSYVTLPGNPNDPYNLNLISETVTENSVAIASAQQSLTVITSDVLAQATFQTNLASLFGTFDENGNLISLSESFANQILQTTSSDRYANAQFVTNLAAEVGTFDANGNLISLSEGFANQILTTTTTDKYATSQFVTNLATSFGTFDANGNLVTLSTSFADSVLSTANTEDFATAQFVTTLGSTFGDVNADGSVTISESFANSLLATANTDSFASATSLDELASAFGTFNPDGSYSISEAKITNELNTYTSLNYASATEFNALTAQVIDKPAVFRQDTEPDIYNNNNEQVIPDGSIWYDTDDDNAIYVVVNGDTPNALSTWEATNDTRIGVLVSKITSFSAKFGSFDASNNFLIDTNADYFDEVKLYADTDSAAAIRITNLGAQIGTFDANNNFTTSFSAGFKQSINNEVDTNSATAGYVNNLSAAVGIDKLDGTPQSQATAKVNGTTSNYVVTKQLNGAVTDSKQLNVQNITGLKIGQYMTYTNSSTLNADRVWRIEAISSTQPIVYLDNEITLSNNANLSFRGNDVVQIDNKTGTIRDGFQVKGNGVTVGTYVSDSSNSSVTLSRAEMLADNTDLEFLGIYAAVTETADVVARVDGTLESSYGLEVDANGNVAGMKLLANNEGSEIKFLADSFKIYNKDWNVANGTAVAPFEVVNGVVKIKTALIGEISFGDLVDTPDSFTTTVIYADDSSGTNASTTKGSSQNYVAFYNDVWQDGDSVQGIVFNQITGDTGPQGPQGDEGPTGPSGSPGTPGNNGLKTVTGVLFWSVGQSTAPTKPIYASNNHNLTEVTYNFSTGAFSGQGLDTNGTANPGVWQRQAPQMAAGTASNRYWTVDYTITQSSDTDSIATLSGSSGQLTVGQITFGTVVRAFAFNQVVVFQNSTSNNGYTTINGGYIETLNITSGNYLIPTTSSAPFAAQGMRIDLQNSKIISEYLYLDENGLQISGNGTFSGNLDAAGGTFEGALNVGTVVIDDGYITMQSNSATLEGTIQFEDSSSVYSGSIYASNTANARGISLASYDECIITAGVGQSNAAQIHMRGSGTSNSASTIEINAANGITMSTGSTGAVNVTKLNIGTGAGIAASGYQFMMNGLILQWVKNSGTSTSTSGKKGFWPLEFPNACLGAVVSKGTNDGLNSLTGSTYPSPFISDSNAAVVNFSRNKYEVDLNEGSNVREFFVIAIGN